MKESNMTPTLPDVRAQDLKEELWRVQPAADERHVGSEGH